MRAVRRVRAIALTASLAGSVLGAATLATVVSAGPATAVPVGSEYPATWAISGNVATGTTPSGVVVTATVTGPAILIPPSGSLIFTGSTPSYFPATTTQALHLLIAECGGPSCGSITYSFSQPVESPVLYTGDIGSGAVNGGVFTEYHDSPVTLSSGTFSLDSPGSQTANMSVQNSGTTVGIADPAAELGASGANPSSCGTFGCGVYDIATPTATVTSVTMDFGYAGTGTSGDIFSQILGVSPVNPSIALNKSVSPSVVTRAGATVTYSYLVTNTGNVTLDNVQPADTAFSGSGTPSPISCPSGTLAAGHAMTCTSTYTVTQADVDAGKVTNTATVTGTPPGGQPVTSSPSSATVTIPAAPAITIRKTASPGSLSHAGEKIYYRYRVTNTGNVPLTGVRVTDRHAGLSAISCPSGTLAVGHAMTCTSTYTVTQADVDAGKVTNTATVTGTPPGGQPVTSSPSSATVTIPAAPAITIKTTASTGTFKDAGTTIHYTYRVTNTGNVPLTGVRVTGRLAGLSAISCPSATLSPGEHMTCTASYVTTQADVQAGSVSSTVTAAGDPPSGARLLSLPSTALAVGSPAGMTNGTPVPVTG